MLRKLLDGRPLLAIYHADDPNGIMFRVAVSDVAFFHSIRDQFLRGIFSTEATKALQLVARREGKEALGDVTITVDQSHFAEQYCSSSLRLDKLTAHQRQKLGGTPATEP